MALRVVYNEVVQTAKYYMRDVTAVESAWLVELAPHFYKQAKVSKTLFYPKKYIYYSSISQFIMK